MSLSRQSGLFFSSLTLGFALFLSSLGTLLIFQMIEGRNERFEENRGFKYGRKNKCDASNHMQACMVVDQLSGRLCMATNYHMSLGYSGCERKGNHAK